MTPAVLLAAVLAGAAAALLAAPVPARRLPSRTAPVGRRGPVGLAPLLGGRAGPVAVAGLVAGVVGLLAPTVLVPALLAGAGAGVAVRRRWRARLSGDAERRRDAVIELCVAMAAELRAGRPPQSALSLAAATTPALHQPLASALTALRAGGDVAGALRAAGAARPAAGTPGAEGLRRLAACWEVAAGTGAGLATALDRVAEGLRAEQVVRREVTAQLAAPRSTARLLAVLPGIGLLLGASIGARPLDVLLGTPLGLGCLAAGLVLSAIGVAWTDRMARTAEEQA